MPVKVKDVVPEVLYLKEPGLPEVFLQGRVCTVIEPEVHLRAMLYNWVAFRQKVELGPFGVVDPDLVGTQMELAVGCLVNEAGPADAACVDFALGEVLGIEALDFEGQVDRAVFKVL